MPSRASTSLLQYNGMRYTVFMAWCQCPHGLVPHCYAKEGLPIADIADVSMPSRASTSLLLPACPDVVMCILICVNALTG